MLDRRVLSKAYFTSEKIVRHHVDSFNDFLDHGLQKVIDEQRIIETEIEGTYVKLKKDPGGKSCGKRGGWRH